MCIRDRSCTLIGKGRDLEFEHSRTRSAHAEGERQTTLHVDPDHLPGIDPVTHAHLRGMPAPPLQPGTTDRPIHDLAQTPQAVQIIITVLAANGGDKPPERGRRGSRDGTGGNAFRIIGIWALYLTGVLSYGRIPSGPISQNRAETRHDMRR